MELTINGEQKEIKSNNVLDLLTELGLDPKITVVEKNQEILKQAAYSTEVIVAGDILELVRFMGGG